MAVVELLTAKDSPSSGHAGTVIAWPMQPTRRTDQVGIDIDPWFTRFGVVPATAVDLARVGIGAFLADQVVRRSSATWSRELRLIVHVVAPDQMRRAIPHLESLLYWVTGDEWTIELVHDKSARPDTSATAQTSEVSLLSGGVDSLCGAVLASEKTAFIGHWDNGAVKRSQNLVGGRIRDQRGGTMDATSVFAQTIAAARRERSTRTRSVMFTSLGTALAAARGAGRLVVPENGFTSLNPPLAPNRGGPNTTRSTHPTTFALANAVNRALGIPVTLENPFQWDTKGQLIQRAVALVGQDWMESSLPETLSCATLNGQWFKGGNPNLNCGVCVACMTRRGAIAAAGLNDRTPYLMDMLEGSALEKFMAERGGDVPVVRACSGWEPNAATLIAMGPFETGFDYSRAQILLARGIQELVAGIP